MDETFPLWSKWGSRFHWRFLSYVDVVFMFLPPTSSCLLFLWCIQRMCQHQNNVLSQTLRKSKAVGKDRRDSTRDKWKREMCTAYTVQNMETQLIWQLKANSTRINLYSTCFFMLYFHFPASCQCPATSFRLPRCTSGLSGAKLKEQPASWICSSNQNRTTQSTHVFHLND